MMDEKLSKWTLANLNKYKDYFGFQKYTIDIEDKTNQKNDYVAEAQSSIYGFKLKIIFYDKYIQQSKEEQFNTIIHELIHARFGYMNDKISALTQELTYTEEELAVNDITRGFIEVLKK